MATLALMLRSFAPDAGYADRLVESFRRFNSEDLHLFCVVPTTDVPLFQHLGGADVTVMGDEQFAPSFVDEDVGEKKWLARDFNALTILPQSATLISNFTNISLIFSLSILCFLEPH